MENKAENTQICRLCLEKEMDNGGFLVEIFSSLINEPGKMSLSEKIRQLFSLKIYPNDGLPSLVCHKCLVLTENCSEFRLQCVKNDEKLRLIFKVNENTAETQEHEGAHLDQQDAETVEEDDEEVITLNPNTLYESSDESENDHPANESQPPSSTVTQNNNAPQSRPVKVVNDSEKKEIYHCRYCDIAFSDSFACNNHEESNHDPNNPYQCVTCSFTTNQHMLLISHIKMNHNETKPFQCGQCSKSFVRRSDLKKHVVVHAGIRLFNCDKCKKSFTRNTNLTKHKRTHSETLKTLKCSLCPKAFYTNSDLSRHLEIHMDRKVYTCKHCNQAFARRDKCELHQKTHFESNAVLQIELPPPVAQPQPIVFYNQPPEPKVSQSTAPLNFYTENMSFNMDHVNSGTMQFLQPKKEYPIMNQLLTGLNVSQMNPGIVVQQPDKNFVCRICSNAFYKKKDLDRHVMTIHTNIKQFQCGSCSKQFSRKDKLLRHEKIHLIPQSVFNCPLCPAVFVREQMLEFHSKVHQIGNGDQKAHLANVQPVNDSNGFSIINPMMDVEASHQLMSAMLQSSLSETTAALYPMNLSISKSPNEPINLSNDREEEKYFDLTSSMKIEAPVKVVDSDDDNESLQIVEDATVNKKMQEILSPSKNMLPEITHSIPEQFEPEHQQFPMIQPIIALTNSQPELEYHEPQKAVEEISFTMSSRIAVMDRLEPLRDLPMEILNND